jgi:hypothetical protein
VQLYGLWPLLALCKGSWGADYVIAQVVRDLKASGERFQQQDCASWMGR